MTAAEAIRITRILRPGSLETDKQEAFIGAYVDHVWRAWEIKTNVQKIPDIIDKQPITEDYAALTKFVSDHGIQQQPVALILLCGLPGCGKSHFSGHLVNLLGGDNTSVTAHVFSQDNIGSKNDLFATIEREIDSGNSRRDKTLRVFVIDRCNVTRVSRREIIDAVAQCWTNLRMRTSPPFLRRAYISNFQRTSVSELRIPVSRTPRSAPEKRHASCAQCRPIASPLLARLTDFSIVCVPFAHAMRPTVWPRRSAILFCQTRFRILTERGYISFRGRGIWSTWAPPLLTTRS